MRAPSGVGVGVIYALVICGVGRGVVGAEYTILFGCHVLAMQEVKSTQVKQSN